MTRTTARLTRLAGGLLIGAVVLTGCSNAAESTSAGGSSSSGAAESSAGSSESFNDADVAFAQQMIVHHRGALAMAQLAEGRTDNEDVLDLAGRIEAAQEPEIETMTGWLEEWGEEVPSESDSMGGMDMGDMDMGDMEMGGMMSEEDMAALEAASGDEFARMFLEMMIEHHRGAVDMAETEIAEGEYPDAVTLAEEIVESQTAEIEEMESILSELGG